MPVSLKPLGLAIALVLLAACNQAPPAAEAAEVDATAAEATEAMADLTANAGEIARFLAAANPNLPEDTVRGLMLAHGAHHAQQVRQVMSGDDAGEARTWTAMQAHMDTIADALAAAIATQFPDKAS